MTIPNLRQRFPNLRQKLQKLLSFEQEMFFRAQGQKELKENLQRIASTEFPQKMDEIIVLHTITDKNLIKG
jgi:hypothetical protein